MGLKGNWVDKVDGESYVLSDDINQIAHAVIEQEEEKEKTTVDAALSEESENPVQNKVIAKKVREMDTAASGLTTRVEALEKSGGGGGGGVSSWNDLTDKPFGENEDGTVKQLDNKYLAILDGKEGTETELLPSTTVTTEFDSTYQMYMSGVLSTTEIFELWRGDGENKTEGSVFVEFDGTSYECTFQRLASLDNVNAVGNCVAFGGTGNGEPFAIAMGFNSTVGGYWIIGVPADTAPTEHTVRIYQSTKGSWKIKHEYPLEQPVSVDMSAFESEGKIVETFADGTRKTTVVEFDADGNPTKITDGDGNVTTLTW